MITESGTRNIICEDRQGRRVTRVRLGHGGWFFVKCGRRGGVNEMGEIGEVVVAENTRDDIRESGERRLYENLSLHGGEI